jgi:hypothetical protein
MTLQTMAMARQMYETHEHTVTVIARTLGVSRASVYRHLGLVLNAVVLWNTRYMDLALGQLKDRGVEVQAADVARLSPLGFRHVNFLGR